MKPLYWLGNSKKAVASFPEETKQEVGYTLWLAQNGDKGINAVPMVGFGGAKVLEVVISDSGEAFRAVYTVKFRNAVYVLHAFHKKAKSGISTPKPDMAVIRDRLKVAESHYKENYEKRKASSNDRSA